MQERWLVRCRGAGGQETVQLWARWAGGCRHSQWLRLLHEENGPWKRPTAVVVDLCGFEFGDLQTVWTFLSLCFAGATPLDCFPKRKMKRLVALWDYFMFSDPLPIPVPTRALPDGTVAYARTTLGRLRLRQAGISCVQKHKTGNLPFFQTSAGKYSYFPSPALSRKRVLVFFFPWWMPLTNAGFLIDDYFKTTTVYFRLSRMDFNARTSVFKTITTRTPAPPTLFRDLPRLEFYPSAPSHPRSRISI